ncbi:MAG: NAD(P)H-dependent oxidoreductase [Planctomycetaceae bacterium]|nr:NAD(P)H-dependent oxidoreductase [Planctomycetaceae bacterium]
MRILAVYAHPSPASFNRSVLDALRDEANKKGHDCAVLDLYRMKWNPVLSDNDFEDFNRGRTPRDVEKMQSKVKDADVVAFIHPLWWFGMPAILKGWIDRVFSYGFAYGHDSRGVKPLLAGKKAIIVNTAGGDEKSSYDDTGYKDAITRLNDDGIYRFVGFDIILRRMFFSIPAKSDSERRELIAALRDDFQKAL